MQFVYVKYTRTMIWENSKIKNLKAVHKCNLKIKRFLTSWILSFSNWKDIHLEKDCNCKCKAICHKRHICVSVDWIKFLFSCFRTSNSWWNGRFLLWNTAHKTISSLKGKIKFENSNLFRRRELKALGEVWKIES